MEALGGDGNDGDDDGVAATCADGGGGSTKGAKIVILRVFEPADFQVRNENILVPRSVIATAQFQSHLHACCCVGT